jgi:iron complex outermembrane receptor protein
MEWEAGWQIVPKLQVSGNLTISKNKIKSFTEYVDNYDTGNQDPVEHNNTDISFSPAVTGSGNINWKPIASLELEWLHKYVGKQYLDNTSNEQRKIDPFYVQDIRASWKLSIRGLRECRLIVQVFNLWNQNYQPNGYTYPYISNQQLIADNAYYPMEGRNFLAAINIGL